MLHVTCTCTEQAECRSAALIVHGQLLFILMAGLHLAHPLSGHRRCLASVVRCHGGGCSSARQPGAVPAACCIHCGKGTAKVMQALTFGKLCLWHVLLMTGAAALSGLTWTDQRSAWMLACLPAYVVSLPHFPSHMPPMPVPAASSEARHLGQQKQQQHVCADACVLTAGVPAAVHPQAGGFRGQGAGEQQWLEKTICCLLH